MGVAARLMAEEMFLPAHVARSGADSGEVRLFLPTPIATHDSESSTYRDARTGWGDLPPVNGVTDETTLRPAKGAAWP